MDCFNFCSITLIVIGTLNYFVIIDYKWLLMKISLKRRIVTLHLPGIPINHHLIAVPTKAQVMEPIMKPNSREQQVEIGGKEASLPEASQSTPIPHNATACSLDDGECATSYDWRG